MTSKISSTKLLKEAIKRNSAFGVLLLVIYFCYYPIGGMLLLRSVENFRDTEQMTRELKMFGVDNPFLFVLTFGIALLLGIVMFAYLHSREKLDFYHSIPVRREKYFLIQCAAGVLLWLVPFVGNLLLFLLACAGRGVDVTAGATMGTTLCGGLLKGILAHAACFLLVYFMTTLAMMLTGKIFAAIAVMAVFCGYVPAIRLLIEVMMEYFFATYPTTVNLSESVTAQCTPVYTYIRVCGDLMEGKFPMDLLLALVLISMLVIGLCLWLYRKRGSEKAGKSMAFTGFARVLKFMLVVPASLTSALTLYALSENSLLWGIVGWILGILLVGSIIEFVYCMDIREVLQDKKQIALSAAVSLAILSVFVFDLTGYDSWLPAKTEVTSMELQNEFYHETVQRRVYSDHVTGTGTHIYESLYTESYEGVYETSDIDAVYDLIEHSEHFQKDAGSGADEQEQSWEYWQNYTNIGVTYHMNDGTQKKRSYEVSKENMKKYFAMIWESEKYRKAMYPILDVNPKDILTIQVARTDYYNPFFGGAVVETAETQQGTEGVQSAEEKAEEEAMVEEAIEMEESVVLEPKEPLTESEMEEMVRTFQTELQNEKFDSAYSGGDYAINIIYRSGNTVYGEEYTLKDSFKETLGLLQKYGYQMDAE
ncbi:MAG: DUF6449 domain-containing protein [Eubacteriales bacterium]|nr:DUF6449 domain-containing protein [Eubacteriales bacterium]